MEKNKIPLNIPNLIGNELKYLRKCIDTNWISTAGKFVNDFEKKLCKFKFSLLKSEDTITGRAAFFDPGILIEPNKLASPLILILSIFITNFFSFKNI